MKDHTEFLELAAAALDFDLEPAEREALAAHLDACPSCRRRVIALQLDASVVRELPAYTLDAAQAQRIWRRIDAPRGSASTTLRLVAITALIALLAVSVLTAGAALLRRDELSRVVSPPPVVAPSPTTHQPSPVVSAEPSGRPPGFAADTIVEVIVTDLRVRTAPTVDDTVSAKLEPLLGLGTRLQVIEGPVLADDYEWYHVQAIGWPHNGWVAAADHDGEPWIEDPSLRDASPTAYSDAERSILALLRADAAVACAPRVAGLPSGALAGVECRPSTALVERVGGYLFDTEQDAARAYLERLQSSGITLGSGDCSVGVGGDASWRRTGASDPGAGKPVPFGGSEWAPARIGCFLDQYGAANVRTTCGRLYIGILGRTEDLEALHRWAWAGPDGGPAGDAPGICTTPATN